MASDCGQGRVAEAAGWFSAQEDVAAAQIGCGWLVSPGAHRILAGHPARVTTHISRADMRMAKGGA